MIHLGCHRTFGVGQRPHRNRLRCGFFLFSVLLTACTDDKPVAFPDGLEPLEEIKVDLPVGIFQNPFLKKSAGNRRRKVTTDGFMPRGYIKSSPSQVWAALREPTVFVDIDKVVEYTVEEQNSSEYDYVFVVDNLVEDIVDVEFVVGWRHGVVDGDLNRPTMVGVRWQRSVGLNLLSHLKVLSFFSL